MIKSVSSSGGKVLAEQDDEDVEAAIAKVKGFDDPLDTDDMERQIMEAKMGKGVDDEEIVFKPKSAVKNYDI